MKVLDPKALPEERLATTDERGRRVYLFPAHVHGKFRIRRDITQVLLIAFFLILPWLTWKGEQLVLFSIPERRFHLFGLTFWAHDTPILFFVLLFATILLAFVTAIWGRVWCGWACPQTVFIDGVFRRIERWVVGSHIVQQQLARAPWTVEKVRKIGLKWFLFVAVGLVISHSFAAYFVGSHQILAMIAHPPAENWTTFLVVMGIAALVVFDFGWFREQFCIIACPYGRIQSLLMDSHSQAVVYDTARGEPRGPLAQKKATGSGGDCVDCKRCIIVCPTGIDIRRGVQMECVACTACMDACDEVMEKIQRPKGLIRYDSVRGLEGKKPVWFRPRVLVYLGILVISLSGLSWAVARREPIDFMVLRGKDVPYQELVDSASQTPVVMNHLKAHIKNQSGKESRVFIEPVTEGLAPELVPLIKVVIPVNPLVLKVNGLERVHFFVQVPRSAFVGAGEFRLTLRLRASAVEPGGEVGGTPGAAGESDVAGPGEEPFAVIDKEVRLVGPR